MSVTFAMTHKLSNRQSVAIVPCTGVGCNSTRGQLKQWLWHQYFIESATISEVMFNSVIYW